MSEELPHLGTIKVPSARKSASFFNPEALSSSLFLFPIGGIAGSIIGWKRQKDEIAHGYREVSEPTLLNRSAISGWSLGSIAGVVASVGLTVATGGLSAPFSVPLILASGAIGSYTNAHRGKERMAQEYAEAVLYTQKDVEPAQNSKPSPNQHAVEPDLGANKHLPNQAPQRAQGL